MPKQPPTLPTLVINVEKALKNIAALKAAAMRNKAAAKKSPAKKGPPKKLPGKKAPAPKKTIVKKAPAHPTLVVGDKKQKELAQRADALLEWISLQPHEFTDDEIAEMFEANSIPCSLFFVFFCVCLRY